MAVAMQGTLLWGQIAGANLTGKLFYFLKVDASGNLVLAGAGDAAVGTCVEEATLGGQATAQLNGIAKVIVSGVIAVGSRLQSDANGQAVILSSGAPLGVLLEPATAANQICSMKLY